MRPVLAHACHDALLDEYPGSHRGARSTSPTLARALLNASPMRIVSVVMVVLAIATRRGDALKLAPQSRCQILARAPQVFVGRVESVATDKRARVDATFTILETLRGTPSRVVHMISGQGAACATLLVPGNELLVLGHDDFAACAEARLRRDATDDLALLRIFATRAVGFITGRVSLLEQPRGSMTSSPRAGIEVHVPHTAFATRTAADGSYRLEVPPGRYKLRIVDADPRLTEYFTSSEPVEVYQHDCTTRDFHEAWNGRIRGRLLDHQGQPAANILVQALDPSRPLQVSGPSISYGPATMTDFDGYYEIRTVPAGSYLVAVSVPFEPRVPIPGTFYPGVATRAAATPVQVGRGDVVSGIDFQLRAPRPLTEVSVVVAKRTTSEPVVVRLTNLAEQRVTEHESWGAREDAFVEEIGARATVQACLAKQRTTCGRPVSFVIEPAAPAIRIEAP